MDENTKTALQSAYKALQTAWNDQGPYLQDSEGRITVTLVAEELQALEDAIALALEL